MSELKKLLKARDRLIVQREYALAGAKFYQNMHLSAQAAIGDIDAAIAHIRAQTSRSTDQVQAARKTAPAKATARGNGALPSTGERFWIGFLDKKGRPLAEVFEDALAALKKEYRFVPTAEQRRALRNRLAVAFHGAVRREVVHSEGSGQDRVYRLPKARTERRRA